MDDVFSGRIAGPKLSQDQKDALQSWVDTIPALPRASGLDAARAAVVARGQALFADSKVGCATCHAGTLLIRGAMKFVERNATATTVVLGAKVIGGWSSGVLQRGMNLGTGARA